jgi:hypothetical protein
MVWYLVKHKDNFTFTFASKVHLGCEQSRYIHSRGPAVVCDRDISRNKMIVHLHRKSGTCAWFVVSIERNLPFFLKLENTAWLFGYRWVVLHEPLGPTSASSQPTVPSKWWFTTTPRPKCRVLKILVLVAVKVITFVQDFFPLRGECCKD